jgi:hypothetical protein
MCAPAGAWARLFLLLIVILILIVLTVFPAS